jgi:mRNA-degrading endonuclease toxin of MazEF toxin-antitoxin module
MSSTSAPVRSSPPRSQANHSAPVSRLTLELDVGGLPKKSWVKISQIRTLSLERIGGRLGRATPEVLDQVIKGLNEIVG